MAASAHSDAPAARDVRIVYWMMLGLVAVFVGAIVLDQYTEWREENALGENFSAFIDVRRLAEAVENYKSIHGRLPEDLDELAKSPGALELVSGYHAELVDPWGRAYRYERDASAAGFKVFTLGRDNCAGGEPWADEDQSAP